MDGGAILNIMYMETLEKMNLTKEQLKHSTTEFHGVVPDKKANSLDSIKLPVVLQTNHDCPESNEKTLIPYEHMDIIFLYFDTNE